MGPYSGFSHSAFGGFILPSLFLSAEAPQSLWVCIVSLHKWNEVLHFQRSSVMCPIQGIITSRNMWCQCAFLLSCFSQEHYSKKSPSFPLYPIISSGSCAEAVPHVSLARSMPTCLDFCMHISFFMIVRASWRPCFSRCFHSFHVEFDFRKNCLFLLCKIINTKLGSEYLFALVPTTRRCHVFFR